LDGYVVISCVVVSVMSCGHIGYGSPQANSLPFSGICVFSGHPVCVFGVDCDCVCVRVTEIYCVCPTLSVCCKMKTNQLATTELATWCVACKAHGIFVCYV